MSDGIHAKVFWSGGSQAVRLPREFRVDGTEVVIRRSGRRLVLEPLPAQKGWSGFWDGLVRLRTKIERGRVGAAEVRRRL
jgi:virulence-associated protein VagC